MNQIERICLVGMLLALTLLCGCASAQPSTLPFSAVPEKPTISNLQPKVDQLLRFGDPVMIRRSIADVFELTDLLLAAGKQDEAMRYLSEALKHNAWALKYQMRYAEISELKGDTDTATQKATLVLDYTEHDDLFERAQRLLGRPALAPIPAIQVIQSNATVLVLVPIGTVDRCVLKDLREQLAMTLPIPVLLQDAGVSVPAFKRDPVKRHLAEVRTNLLAGMKQDARLATFLMQKGVTEAALERDEVIVEACRHLAFESGGTNAVAQFEAGMRQLAQASKQWDIEDLLTSFKKSVTPFRKGNVYFLGVSNLDAYVNQSNFIFGSVESDGHHGVITCRRFSADFNGDNENRRRLVERTFKQTLSSFGFMLGVDRCSTPTCARAYPHNLNEHDAKSKDLCPACKNGFERVLGASVRSTDLDQPRRP